MSRAQVDAIMAALKNRPAPPPDIAARREGFERFAAMVSRQPDPMPDVVALAPGVTGRWFGTPQPGAPVVLYLHGGAFMVGSSASHAALTAAIAQAAGMAVFSLDYALAPEQPFPAALNDVMAALCALEAAGWPAGRVAIAGDSAGGNLALAAAHVCRQYALPMPGALVSISGYLDLTNSAATIATHAARDPFVAVPTMPGTAAAYAGGADVADPRVSPLWGAFEGFPPLLLMTGSEEVLLDDSARCAARAAAASVDVAFESWAGMIHAWPFFLGTIDEAAAAASRVGAFVRRVLLSA
jgi:acetyl esterase/lipase